MQKLSENSKRYLSEFYFDGIEVPAFEKWLYGADGLEVEIGKERYLDLISFDYTNSADVGRAKDLISIIYNSEDEDALFIDRTKHVLSAMLEKKISLADGCKMLADLKNNGFDFIPVIFVGYSSEIARLGDNGFYDERIVADARKLLIEIGRR